MLAQMSRWQRCQSLVDITWAYADTFRLSPTPGALTKEKWFPLSSGIGDILWWMISTLWNGSVTPHTSWIDEKCSRTLRKHLKLFICLLLSSSLLTTIHTRREMNATQRRALTKSHARCWHEWEVCSQDVAFVACADSHLWSQSALQRIPYISSTNETFRLLRLPRRHKGV